MIVNLKSIYGQQLFDRNKAYGNPFYFNLFANLLVGGLLAWVLVEVTEVMWEFALIKMFLLLELLFVLRYIVIALISYAYYKAVSRRMLAQEMRHYLNLFIGHVEWDDIGWYDSLFLAAAFSDTLEDKLKILAAISYGNITATTSLVPQLDDRLYDVYGEVIEDYRSQYGN